MYLKALDFLMIPTINSCRKRYMGITCQAKFLHLLPGGPGFFGDGKTRGGKNPDHENTAEE